MSGQAIRDDKAGLARKKKTIDMVTRLYVSIIRAESDISLTEINILYSLLVNLFRYVDVSWEAYVRRIIDNEFDTSEVVDYLNKHLGYLDKTRVVLSLIIMAKTDSDFSISDLTGILEICKSFGLDPDSYIHIVDTLEFESTDIVHIPYAQNISSVFNSIFTDYVVLGRDSSSHLRFRSSQIAPIEMFITAIDTRLFVGSGTNTNAEINGQKLKTNSIYMLNESSTLRISDVQYDYASLWKIYNALGLDDDIAFSKAAYDFVLHNSSNRYTITTYHGTVYLNGRQLKHGKKYHVFHDDTLQIRGYSPFQLLDVIRERSNIGINSGMPPALYIDFIEDYYIVSTSESNHSFAMIEIKDGEYFLYPPKRGWSVFLNQESVTEVCPLIINKDIITINKHNFRFNSFHDLVEIPFELEVLSALDIKHYFKDGQLGIDSVSFEVKKGELVGIMGPSGSGKSTLLKALCTELVPTYGEVQIDGKSIYSNLNYYTQFLGYVPQDDLLYPYLTVYENLWYRGRLRMPKLSKTYLDKKIYNILNQVNLLHRKDVRVGDYKRKLLSGGERKRLNIALELLFEPTIIICDEPTSGLSYNDTEQIIDILNNLTHQGKIIVITIHQPSSTIFKKFHKVLLMDMQGKQVYYGDPLSSFEYFDHELTLLTYRNAEIAAKKHAMTSDYMYEVIQYPEYNDRNEPVFEQQNKMLQIKRKFPPEYWRDKFKRKMLYEIIQHETPKHDYIGQQAIRKRKRKKQDIRSQLSGLLTFVKRSLKMKTRNSMNSIITFIEAPLLAFIIAFILRLAPEGETYSYSQNTNIGIFIFVSVIAFVFMGLSNSIEEIYDERKMILREKMMNLRISHYLLSKHFSLSVFTVVQVLLYTIVASLILGIRGVFFQTVIYLILSGMVGFSIGLFVSSFIKDNKAIINLLPLILIPQIIFGGAVIEYERMNRSIIIQKSNPIPEVVQVIPSRWLFEGMLTAYAKNTAFHSQIGILEKKKLTYIKRLKENAMSYSQYDKALAKINENKAKTALKWDPDRVVNEYLGTSVSLMDGRFANTDSNVFMSSFKRINGKQYRTWNFNMIVLLIYICLFNIGTILKLKYLFKE